jgi:hypothetical protein
VLGYFFSSVFRLFLHYCAFDSQPDFVCNDNKSILAIPSFSFAPIIFVDDDAMFQPLKFGYNLAVSENVYVEYFFSLFRN